MSSLSIDINCDLGESLNKLDWQQEAKLMPFISSANIACGGHAGNEKSIQVTISNALKNHLKIGAHPSFPDKKNFGRLAMDISTKNLRASIREQLNFFTSICHQNNARFHHVKPHGALYNLAANDLNLAKIIAEESSLISSSIKLMGLADSEMKNAAQFVGLDFINEGFIDRLYHLDGTLVNRKHSHAVHQDIQTCLDQALNIALSKSINTFEANAISIHADSICLHGDNPNAVEIAKLLNQHLTSHNIQIR